MDQIKQPEHAVPITLEQQLANFRQGVKEVYKINLRGKEIPVRVLSIDEIQQIRAQVISDAAINNWDETAQALNVQKYTLALASTLNGTKIPTLPTKLLGMMSYDEVKYIYEEYMKVLDDVNPSVERMTPEMFKSLVELVKKKELTSRDLSLSQLRAIFSAFQELVRTELQTSPPAN